MKLKIIRIFSTVFICIRYWIFVFLEYLQIYGADGSLLRAESRRGRGKGRGGGAVSILWFFCIDLNYYSLILVKIILYSKKSLKSCPTNMIRFLMKKKNQNAQFYHKKRQNIYFKLHLQGKK